MAKTGPRPREQCPCVNYKDKREFFFSFFLNVVIALCNEHVPIYANLINNYGDQGTDFRTSFHHLVSQDDD